MMVGLQENNTNLRTVVLSTLFTLTGVGIALPGALLPAMMQKWGMSDRDGGLLLLLLWGGSTAAVLLTRGKLEWSVARGVSLATVAMFGLATTNRVGALGCTGVYGLGLGIMMTSISILRSKQVEQHRCTFEMNRLNMLWALGACFGPLIALRGLRMVRVETVFGWMGMVFAVGLVSLLMIQRGSSSAEQRVVSGLRRVPLWLCLVAALSVGIESSLGGWLTTFAGRTTHAVGLAVPVSSAFWAGLLLSRAAHASRRLHLARSPIVIFFHMCLVVMATVSLLSQPRGAALFSIAMLAGLGLGPLYPFALSIVLPRFQPRVVFLMAGAGSAVCPWLTGAMSTQFGSLRMGLTVPFVASLVLLLAGRQIDCEARETVVLQNI